MPPAVLRAGWLVELGLPRALEAQVLHPVLLVDRDLPGHGQARVEARVRDGSEHRLSRLGRALKLADDATLVARVADPGHAAVHVQDDAVLCLSNRGRYTSPPWATWKL